MGRLLWIRHNVGEMWDLPDFEDELDKKEETNG